MLFILINLFLFTSAQFNCIELNEETVQVINENILNIKGTGDLCDCYNNEFEQYRKSIEKIQEAIILPLYKFVLPKTPSKELSNSLREQISEEGYFDGINVYQSYFNDELINILEYFDDYIIIYDEFAEIFAKLVQINENLKNSYNEALKNNLIEPLKELNHFSDLEIIKKTASYQKISLNNFLTDECNEIIDVDSRNIPIFDANMDNIIEFLMNKKMKAV
jgi:hypothetical protein